MSRLGQVSQHYQKILWNAPNVETVSAVMDEFVQAAQHGKHQQAGFANNALATSKLGVHAVARVHAKQLYAKKVRFILLATINLWFSHYRCKNLKYIL